MSKQFVNTLIFSDVHLGTELSRADILLDNLKKYEFKRLILLGDIFDDVDFKKLQDIHWELLKYISEIIKDKKIEILWLRGNHDHLLDKISSLFLGINIIEEYKWEVNNIKFFALHGHQFDTLFPKNKLVLSFVSFVYHSLRKLDTKNRVIITFIKKKSNMWRNISRKLADRSMEYATPENVNVVICGHSHDVYHKKNNQIEYFNTGCWVDKPSNFITISDSGEVETHYFY